MYTTSHLHKDLDGIFDGGLGNFGKVFTKNYVTLGSGGVGWTTGYQDYHKTYLGVARSTQNGVWGTLDLEVRIKFALFFLYILPF